MHAEGIRGEEPVFTDVPPRRSLRVLGMIEDGDADGLAIDGAGVIAPLGAFAPGFLVAVAATGDAAAHGDAAFADLGFLLAGFLRENAAHGFIHAHRHGTFLGVAEHDVFVAGLEGDFEVEQALVARPGEDAEGALIGHGDGAIGRDPFVCRADDAGVRAALHFEKLVVNDLPGLRGLRPEVHAVHRAVRIPERAVMRMILLLAGHFLHRPVARHGCAARAEQGIEVNVGRAFETVVGEVFAVDLDAKFVRLLGDLDAVSGDSGERQECGKS